VRIDIGQVGEIESIDPSIIQTLQANGFIPVIAPIGSGRKPARPTTSTPTSSPARWPRC
jgi:acetylglutamate kinase